MKLKFFNLNIKHKHYSFDPQNPDVEAAQYWLDQKGAAPIFFNRHTCEEILANPDLLPGKYRRVVKQYLTITQRGEIEGFIPIFVTIESGYVWIYMPKGAPQNGDEFGFYESRKAAMQQGQFDFFDIPKYYEVNHLISRKKLSDVPYILAAMKSSQAFAQGTFRCLDENINGEEVSRYEGNLAALKVLLKDVDIAKEHIKTLKVDPLHCLSSIELETLIAKIFEANNCFVPAHRGGVLKGVDLFVSPLNGRKVECLGVEEYDTLNIQVKINTPAAGKELDALARFLEESNDRYLITSELTSNPRLESYKNDGRYLTADWIKTQIKTHPVVAQWFSRSLEWLPQECRH